MIVNELCQVFLERHASDAVRLLESKGPADAASLLAELPPETAAAALGRMDPSISSAVLAKLPGQTPATLLVRLDPQRGAAILRRVSKETRAALLKGMPADKRRPLELLLSYPENTVGARMDPLYPCLPEDLTLAEAVERVRDSRERNGLFWFSINRDQKLTGVVSVRELLSRDSGRRISETAHRVGQHVSALTDVASIGLSAELMRLNALPVIDEKGVYLGAIRQESVIELDESEEFATDSIQAAGSALGELYRLGLSGLVHSIERKPGTNIAVKELNP